MRHAIKQAFHCGMPLVAECGGFMYLHSRIIDKEGVSHDMAGGGGGTWFLFRRFSHKLPYKKRIGGIIEVGKSQPAVFS